MAPRKPTERDVPGDDEKQDTPATTTTAEATPPTVPAEDPPAPAERAKSAAQEARIKKREARMAKVQAKRDAEAKAAKDAAAKAASMIASEADGGNVVLRMVKGPLMPAPERGADRDHAPVNPWRVGPGAIPALSSELRLDGVGVEVSVADARVLCSTEDDVLEVLGGRQFEVVPKKR